MWLTIPGYDWSKNFHRFLNSRKKPHVLIQNSHCRTTCSYLDGFSGHSTCWHNTELASFDTYASLVKRGRMLRDCGLRASGHDCGRRAVDCEGRRGEQSLPWRSETPWLALVDDDEEQTQGYSIWRETHRSMEFQTWIETAACQQQLLLSHVQGISWPTETLNSYWNNS